MSQSSIDWSDEEYRRFGLEPQVTRHRFHELPLFEEASLKALLDDYPRRNLQCYTMGTDPIANGDWKQVDIAPDTNGEGLWQAVQRGRLWLNLTHIERNNDPIGALIQQMYEHLGNQCPHLQNPRGTHSALLISSPGAQVYYHLDAEPNMLWHIRGQKEVWLYPAMDLSIVPQEFLEDIYAGEIGENLPYFPGFDASAKHAVLTPGDAASWPHNGPHRIVNMDLNVSLATSYYTPAVYRRQYVQLANRFLLRNLGIRNRRVDEDGLMPSIKRMSYRVINKVRPFKRRSRSAGYITMLQLDPDSEDGLRLLDEPRLASFASDAASDAVASAPAKPTHGKLESTEANKAETESA